MFRYSLIVALIFCTGCATHYKGPPPNFALQGAEAEKEIEKFSINRWTSGSDVFDMPGMSPGPTIYWKDFMMPIVESVSPEGSQRLKRVKYIQYANVFFLVAALAVFIGDSHDNNFEVQEVYYGLLGLAVASTVYGHYEVNQSLKQYNQDLRGKFTPKVTLLKLDF